MALYVALHVAFYRHKWLVVSILYIRKMWSTSSVAGTSEEQGCEWIFMDIGGKYTLYSELRLETLTT